MVRVIGVSEIVLFVLVLSVVVYVYYARGGNSRKRHLQEPPPGIDWDSANDDSVRSLLPHRKIAAIKVYRELTGASLKSAKAAVEYLMANPDDYGEDKKKEKNARRDAGIRDLIRQGRVSEAIDIYREFTGVSPEEAAEDIAQIEQELELEDSYDHEDSARNAR
jgi:ribosomal protein L7/L12